MSMQPEKALRDPTSRRDQLDAINSSRLKRINEELVNRTAALESSQNTRTPSKC